MTGTRQWRHIGRTVPRPEDPALLRGTARTVADLREPGCVELAFVRSWAAHGRLVRVDPAPARDLPGVLAAWAAADLADVPGPGPHRPVLAGDRVRFVGDPVAVVVAADRYLAEDGADLVEVEIEPLPAVIDPVAAAADGAVRLFEGRSNVSNTIELGTPCADEVAASPVVVETTVRSQRISPMSLEARAILVRPEPDGGLTVWCSHQAPHRLRDALAAAFGLDPADVRVRVPAVGGAFGAKSQTYPEYLVAVVAARRLGRPVRWVEDRYEALTAATHGRGQLCRLRLGLDPDGRFRALEARIWADVGAYPDTGNTIAHMTAWQMSGAYAIPQVHVTAQCVVTNAAPTASYRGAGRPEAAYAIERCVDDAARRLGLDPAELRRRNFVPPDAFPYSAPTGARYDSGRYADALEAALAAAGYAGWRREQRRRREAGDDRLLGVGIAAWVERSGGPVGSSEYARVELTGAGEVVARVGIASQGQGHLAPFAQVVAEGLGVAPERVRVVLGDTGEVPVGAGTFGSRGMQIGGNAAYLAAQDLHDLVCAEAVTLLGGGAPADVVFDRDGAWLRCGDRGIGLDELAAKVDGLAAERTLAPPQAFPFGCYVAVVEVDRRLGDITVLRLVAVDDCGVVVHPAIVRGQVTGSIVQGLGQALYEGIRYDPQGQPQTGTLLDYTVPTAAEVPPLTLVEQVTPNPNVPLGTKGAGESGCLGTPPAIANAVHDALAGYDRHGLETPLTPQAVWECLQRPRGAAP